VPSRFKELTVRETVARYKESGGMVVVDYPGVTAEEATAFRRELREQSVEFRVVRKNLAKVAFGELGYPELSNALEGRVAIVSAGDPVEASKAAAKLAKDMKFKVKGGWGDGKVLSVDEITMLSKIPSREALLAQIAGLAVAPLRGLVGMIAAPAASLARAIKAWNEKREGGESGDSSAE
jgi:large subunit ribosomal protein L10